MITIATQQDQFPARKVLVGRAVAAISQGRRRADLLLKWHLRQAMP